MQITVVVANNFVCPLSQDHDQVILIFQNRLHAIAPDGGHDGNTCTVDLHPSYQSSHDSTLLWEASVSRG